MGFYNVVKPCVVGKLHYVRPTKQPIEVADDVAAPLVEDGSLESYRPGGVSGKTGTVLDGAIKALVDADPELARVIVADPGEYVVGDDEPSAEAEQAEEPKRRSRSRRRTSED